MKKLLPLIRLVRPRQWTKNVFVVAPLIFSFKLFDLSAAKLAIFAMMAFCFLSSAIYIFNDLLDIEADRKHLKKNKRPLAAKTVTIPEAVGLLVVLSICAIVVLMYAGFNWAIYFLLAFYVIVNIAYNLGVKHVALLELFIVASGYLVRLLVGCVAIQEAPSPWILAATGTLALLIAAGKRRGEIAENYDPEYRRRSLQGYNLDFLDSMIVMLASVTMVTYLLFTTSDYAIVRFHSPYIISTSVFVLYGVLRYMQLVKIGTGADDPTSIILKDKSLCLTIIGWVLCWVGLIYFR